MKNNVKWELTPEIVARHFLRNVSTPVTTVALRWKLPLGSSSYSVRKGCDHPAEVRESFFFLIDLKHISTVQQNDHFIYMCPFSYSIVVCHRILNIVPCCVQWDLAVYPPYIVAIYSLLIPDSQSIPPQSGNHKSFPSHSASQPGMLSLSWTAIRKSMCPPPGQSQVCSLRLWICFCFIDHSCHILDSTYK